MNWIPIEGTAAFAERATDRRVNLVNFATQEISKGPKLFLKREAVVAALEKMPRIPISGYPPNFSSHSYWHYGEITEAILDGDAVRVRGHIYAPPESRSAVCRAAEAVDAIRDKNLGLCVMLRNVEVEAPTAAELDQEVDASDPLALHVSLVSKCEFSSIALMAHDFCDFKGTSIKLVS